MTQADLLAEGVHEAAGPGADEVGPILIVDDDGGDRMLCIRALKDAFGSGQAVLEADSGEGAIDAVERNGIACVLLDYAIPGLNGITR